jgi:hypothetical protein
MAVVMPLHGPLNTADHSHNDNACQRWNDLRLVSAKPSCLPSREREELPSRGWMDSSQRSPHRDKTCISRVALLQTYINEKYSL